MKMKFAVVILAIVGLGLIAQATYLVFFDEVYDHLDSTHAAAQEKYKEAAAAQGTAREATLLEEARLEADSAERFGGYARKTRRTGQLFGLGGLAAIAVSAVPVVISRRRAAVPAG